MSACLVKHFVKDDIPTSRIKVIPIGEHTVALTCRHCADAPCVNACPVGALYFDGNRVAVNMHQCIGCKGCVKSCPYGAASVINSAGGETIGTIAVEPVRKQVVIKCDLCYDREGGPACVEACTSNAITLVEQREIDEGLKSTCTSVKEVAVV